MYYKLINTYMMVKGEKKFIVRFYKPKLFSHYTFAEEREKYIDRIVKCLPNDAGELNDFYNYIKQALKRNEPTKVKKVLICDDPRIIVHHCPNCDEELFKTDISYCPCCGQKLDWNK
mgnify:CR=1 FL=1